MARWQVLNVYSRGMDSCLAPQWCPTPQLKGCHRGSNGMKEMGSSTLGNQMTECEPHSYGPDPATLLPPELSSWLQRRRGKGRWASLPPAPSYTRQRGTEGASHPLLLLKSPVRSRRRCGRMPSGPTVDPLGKEQMVCATSSTVTVQLVMDPSEGGGIQELGCGDGCFTFRAIMVSSFNCRTELL